MSLLIRWQEVAEGLSGELAEFLFNVTPLSTPGGHAALLSSIRTPCLPKEVDTWMTGGRTVIQSHGFRKLPLEIFDMVMDQLQWMELFVLALTCKDILSALRSRLLTVLKELHAPWRNCPLILLGRNTAQHNGLPTSIHLTSHQRAKIMNGAIRRYGEHTDSYTYALGRTDPLYHLRRHIPKGLRDAGRSGRGSWRSTSTSTIGDCQRFCVLWGSGAPVCYPDGTPVLCNVSKAEYVRADGLTAPDVTLAHALLVRIAWSTDTSTGFPCADGVAQALTSGPWAGDKVSVDTMETLPTLPLGRREEGWVDVTSEVNWLLWNLWTASHQQDHGA
ncbi:hypothetical protein ONZ51_g7994 [Trametes cubensis]|uniref:F-box domain-containing protein n=1 Tax=Trametes cubensis TaxID=1111947 RepID=A0AAD7X8Y9_9APHY|nr:hypothetical protein ONZ51_g7994 [Trametes cubensis]